MIDFLAGRADVPDAAAIATEETTQRVCRAVGDVLEGTAEGSIALDRYREELEARGVVLVDVLTTCGAAEGAIRQHQRERPRTMGMDDTAINRVLAAWQKHPLSDVLPLLQAVAEDWGFGFVRLQSVTARMVPGDGGVLEPQFLVHIRKSPHRALRAILNLDASADRTLAAAVFGSDVKMETIGARRFARVVQVAGTSFSKTAVGIVQGKEGSAVAAQRMKFVVEGLRLLMKAHGTGRVACITYKDLAPEIARRVPGIMAAHFGRLRGLNAMEKAGALVVVGRPLPPAQAVEDQARALVRGTGRVLDLPGAYRWEHRGVRTRDGRRIGLPMRVHPDPVVEALRASVCEREVEQAIDRLRAVRREDDPPDIYILADEVLDVTLDEVVDARAWLAGLAAGDALRDGRPVVVGERWARDAAGGALLQDTDTGMPLAERQAEIVTGAVGAELVSRAVRSRCAENKAQSPIDIFIQPTALRFELGGTILKGERNARTVLVPEHLARDLPALRQMVARMESRSVPGLALLTKPMIELAKSARIAAMKDALKPEPDTAVTWLSAAMDTSAALAGYPTFEAWAEAAGPAVVLWGVLVPLAQGDEAVRASAWHDARFARFMDGVLCDAWGGALAALGRAPAASPWMQAAALMMELVAFAVVGVGDLAATIRALPRTLTAVVDAVTADPFFTLRQVATLDDALRVLAAAGGEGDEMVPGMTDAGMEGRPCAAI